MRAVRLNAERAVALRQLCAVRPMDQRNMRHDRHIPAHGVIDDRLPGGVGEVVVAADDVGDAHVVVVHDDRVHIGRNAVRTQDDEVVEVLVGETHVALDAVAHDRLAFASAPLCGWRASRRLAPRTGRGRASVRHSGAAGPRRGPSPASRSSSAGVA